jgi:hypothetical protein
MNLEQRARELAEELIFGAPLDKPASEAMQASITKITNRLHTFAREVQGEWISVGMDWEAPADLDVHQPLEFVDMLGNRVFGFYSPGLRRFISDGGGHYKPMYVQWYRKPTPLPAAPKGDEA